jgi:hypothetical protein
MTAKTTNDTSRLMPTKGVIITDHTTMQRSATKSPSTKKKTLESSKKKPTRKKEKIHTSKKQCIREDPTQLLEDDNVHTGRKRSNKRRTRKTKKKPFAYVLTYLLTSHCDSNKDAILFPSLALPTHCYCANSYFAAANQPQALHQRDAQGGTRTHAWSSSSERQRRVHVASRERTSPPTLLLLLLLLLPLLSLVFT